MFYLLTEKLDDGSVYAVETLFPTLKAAGEHVANVSGFSPDKVLACDPMRGTCIDVSADAAAVAGEWSFTKQTELDAPASRWCWQHCVDVFTEADLFASHRSGHRDREAARIAHRNAVL